MVENTTGRGAADPVPYLFGLAGLILFFAYWSSRHSYPAKRQVQWVLYLLIMVHWLGTLINMPSPPSKESDGAG